MTSETTQADGIVETGPLIERTYAEALDLTQAVRDYIAGQAPHDKAQLDHDTQLVASCEEMRVTARMTQVMAWLMLQRAVQAGEVDRAETTRPDNRRAAATSAWPSPPSRWRRCRTAWASCCSARAGSTNGSTGWTGCSSPPGRPERPPARPEPPARGPARDPGAHAKRLRRAREKGIRGGPRMPFASGWP
ncbi:MAG: DUF1465 family protein [Xanthomonadales bacterium]|nr:DUF1465 family protein [Xanthomonadales bacterium]